MAGSGKRGTWKPAAFKRAVPNAAAGDLRGASPGPKAASPRGDPPRLPPAGDRQLREGVRLYKARRYREAYQALREARAAAEKTRAASTAPTTVVESPPAGPALELAYYLGLCCVKLGRHDDAFRCLEQVISAGQNPQRIYQCRMNLALIYIESGRAKMAEFELHRLASNGFETAQLYAALGYAAWSQNRAREAVDYYEKALGLDRNSATALNGLGYILADSGLDPARGLQSCKRAVEMQPRNAAYLDSLGWAYFKNGDLLEARAWLRRALDLAPGEREIQDHVRQAAGEERRG